MTVVQAIHGQTDSTRHIGDLAVGIDLSRFLVQVWQPVKANFEFTISSNVYKDIYLNGDGGWMVTEFTDEEQHYTSGGYYLRAGPAYNILKRRPGDHNMIYIGVLYGFADYWHEADQITISDGYWGSGSGRLDRKTLKSHWLELKVGIRIEVLKNWFLGWAIQPRFYLSGTEDKRLPPYIVPGFGKGENAVNIGMSYYVGLRIPYGRNK
jgi:hypothetical protein